MDGLILGRRPTVFLDRDGVLCEEKSYLRTTEEMHIFPYSKECIDRFHDMGFLAIVVTNQSGIARGYLSIETLTEMNVKLQTETNVDAIYYCPHYVKGIIPGFSIGCDCRKPKTGMVDKARADFHVDMGRSFMVGDRSSDIRLGDNAGLKTILLESGYGTSRMEEPVLPDYILGDLRDVVDLLEEGNF